MNDFIQIAGQPGVAGWLATWLLVVLLALLCIRSGIAVLDAALELRNKWFRRPR